MTEGLVAPGAAAVQPLLLKPDELKVRAIIRSVDRDGNGFVSKPEVKSLFSQLFDIPIDSIPDDHEEVVAFAGLNFAEAVELLMESTGKAEVNRYYQRLFVEDNHVTKDPLGIWGDEESNAEEDGIGSMVDAAIRYRLDNESLPPNQEVRYHAKQCINIAI